MGESYHFRCQQCDYRAEVSGGDDIGFIVKTRTVFCPTCRALRDITIEYWCQDLLTDADRANLNEEDLGRCWKCGSRELTNWSAGDPCPRCGGPVNNEGLALNWD